LTKLYEIVKFCSLLVVGYPISCIPCSSVSIDPSSILCVQTLKVEAPIGAENEAFQGNRPGKSSEGTWYILYPVYTIKQTSSRHRTNIEQTSSWLVQLACRATFIM